MRNRKWTVAGLGSAIVRAMPALLTGVALSSWPGPVRANEGQPRTSPGLLQVSSTNPRYFADPAGHIVYLAGSHTWNDLVDMGDSYPPRAFDFTAYLDFLDAHGHNLLRLWAWEIPWRNDTIQDPHLRVAAPQPWMRTGPGKDFGGQPRFDLTRLNPKYFARLKGRVKAASERGIYVIVMLFEAHVAQIVPTNRSHPFFRQNNINHTDYLENVEDAYTLRFPEITRIQETYLRAVVDTLNEFDNILYEIADEGGAYSTEWQYAMLEYLRTYEAGKPKQHPIGMTYQIGGTNQTLYASDADWVAPGAVSEHYSTAPQPAAGRKVIIADTDHLGGAYFQDPRWVWLSFFRGLNVSYMDNYAGPDSIGLPPIRAATEIRAAIGLSRLVAEQIDIGDFLPSANLSSSAFALSSGDALLVYAPDQSALTVDLSGEHSRFVVEWLDIETGAVTAGDVVAGGSIVPLEPPTSGGSLLYLRSSADSRQPLAGIQTKAEAIWRNALNYSTWSVRLQVWATPLLRPLSQSKRRLVLTLGAVLVAGFSAGMAMAYLMLRGRARTVQTRL